MQMSRKPNCALALHDGHCLLPGIRRSASSSLSRSRGAIAPERSAACVCAGGDVAAAKAVRWATARPLRHRWRRGLAAGMNMYRPVRCAAHRSAPLRRWAHMRGVRMRPATWAAVADARALRSLRQGPTVGAVDSRGRPVHPTRGPVCGPRAPGPGAIVFFILFAVAALALADLAAVRRAPGGAGALMRALTWRLASRSASRFRWRSPREPRPTPAAARVRRGSTLPPWLPFVRCADAAAWRAASIAPLFASATVAPGKGLPLLPPSVRAAAAAASAGAPQPSPAEGQGGVGGGSWSVGSLSSGLQSSAGGEQQQSQGVDNTGQQATQGVALGAGGAAVALPVAAAAAAAGSGGTDAPGPAAAGAWRHR